MQFARLNDVTLHFQMIGSPESRPLLVFANSLGTDFRIWRDIVVRLAGEFSILTYDLRGHGLSDIGAMPNRIEDHAADLAGLLDLIGARQATIVGVSVGGMIAQALYASRPDLVRALVLCDTAAKIGDEAFWNNRIAAIEANGIESIADAILGRWFTPAFRSSGNPAFAGYRNMLIRQPVAGYVATCAALRDADLTAAASAIGVPTLCVVGDGDGSTPPALVASLAKLIPGARFEIIEACGHLPCIEQPEALVGIMRAFFALTGTETISHVSH
ncbi:MAG: 3-oxoadipate enol-lactonase [Devosia sp.]|nr:3-oxoadipate enol-lactonase [Devosia sp.]